MSEYNVLKELGLTQTEIKCYKHLFNEGATHALDLAERLGKKPTGIYRQLRNLEAKGFVTSVKTEGQPMYFYTNTVEEALQKLGDWQRQTVEQLIAAQYLANPARRPKRR